MKKLKFISRLIVFIFIMSLLLIIVQRNSCSAVKPNNNETDFPFKKTCRVTYNGNGNTGGVEPVDNKTYKSGDIATVLDNTFDKTDYIFEKWNTKADGTGRSYLPSNNLEIGIDEFPYGYVVDVILYAQWKPKEYNLTVTISPSSVKYNKTISISAYLTSGGVPIGGKPLTFEVNGAEIGDPEKNKTDSNGKVVLNNVKENLKVGLNSVTVYYIQDGEKRAEGNENFMVNGFDWKNTILVGLGIFLLIGAGILFWKKFIYDKKKSPENNTSVETKESGLESRMLLALACKLKFIFENEDKYLAFPNGIVFTHKDLNFMEEVSESGLSAQEKLKLSADFARIINIIPEDCPMFPSGFSSLSEKLVQVLDDAEFAESTLTQEETEQFEKASAFLYEDVHEGEIIVHGGLSAAVKKYYELKTVYENYCRLYSDEKMTVESSGPDSDVLKQKWNEYREKELLQSMENAEKDWINQGYKQEVENYQSIYNKLFLKKNSYDFLHDYLKDIELSEIQDITSGGIDKPCVTFFSPSNIFDSDLNWPELHLTKEEIEVLVQNAPMELKNIFNYGEEGEDEIQSVSLEYNNVVIIRPWFKPEFFQSRVWRLRDLTSILDGIVSDGNRPRQGYIPAYITSMIVARNIKVKKKGKFKDHVKSLKVSTVEKKKENNLQKYLESINLTLNTRKELNSEKGSVNDEAKMIKGMQYMAAKYNGLTIETPKLQADEKSGEKSTDENYLLEEFVVLAYVCKRMPKSPNPLETLKW